MPTLIETIISANNNWKRAAERGDAKAMTQNNAIVQSATDELISEGFTLQEIWDAVDAAKRDDTTPLNSITAERYTVETVRGARVISSAISCYPEIDGTMVYTVPFRLPDAGVSDIFRMNVWIDVDGRIYGEW